MTLGIWASLAWLTEFLLESTGAYFAFRRRLKILSFLLAWRAIMDVVTFAIFALNLHPGYGYTFWAGQAVQYALLYALGIQLAAKMVQDYRPITQYVYKIWAVAASVCAYVFVTTELFEHKFARAEAISSFLLLAVVLLGWIGRKKGLEEPWRLIVVALCVATAGNAACAVAASTFLPAALSLYPIPAILALLIWNLSVLPRKKIKQADAAWEEQKFKPVGVKIRVLTEKVQ